MCKECIKLQSADNFPFPKVKLQLAGARFGTIQEIQKAVTDKLQTIPAKGFSSDMKKLATRANQCITSNGSYFKQINRKISTRLIFLVLLPLARKLSDRTVYIQEEYYKKHWQENFVAH